VFSFSIDMNVDKMCVRITVNSSWLIYLLNLGTCMEHLRQWTKEARSSLKLQFKMASGRRACRKQRIFLQCWRRLCFWRWCNTSFLSKGA